MINFWKRLFGGSGDRSAADSVNATTTINIEGLIKGTTYAFSVSAMDEALNESARSDHIQVTTLGQGTSVHDEVKHRFLMFPNPTNGKFTIKLEGDMANELLIYITDASGRFIVQRTIPSGVNMLREKIDFSDKPDGIYFIHIMNGEDHLVGKVLVH